uniref:Class I SAM-dependent methyltransferase n=1 Tax=Toxocara canis TaxID=6265 RepID=A0A183VG36_TOXCA
LRLPDDGYLFASHDSSPEPWHAGERFEDVVIVEPGDRHEHHRLRVVPDLFYVIR